MKLGQILLHRGAIDRYQLTEALRRQRRSGKPVGQILLQMGLVSRPELIAAFKVQPKAWVDAVRLGQVERRVATSIPVDLQRRHVCAPLMQDDGTLVVAMADPLDRDAIAELEAITGHDVVGVAAEAADIAAAVDRLLPEAGPAAPAVEARTATRAAPDTDSATSTPSGS